MNTSDRNPAFHGTIPQVYQQYLVPMIFDPYAASLMSRVVACQPASVLEVAAGTGAVTRQIANALPATTQIIATDISTHMLEHAAAIGTSRAVEWRQADAMQLPFPDESVDALVCQFGCMFFPDKPKAFSEARRVLRAGGHFIFSAWDRIEENEFADIVTNALAMRYPQNPPRFLAQTPHGYFDVGVIARDVARAGFAQPANIVTVAERSRAESPMIVAIAYCQGTPLRNEIEARDPSGLSEATRVAAKAIEAQFGAGAVDGKIQAHIVTVAR